MIFNNYFNKFNRKLQSGDFMTINMKDGKMIYKINDTQLDVVINVSKHDNNEMHLLVHDRDLKSKCNIVYITELLD